MPKRPTAIRAEAAVHSLNEAEQLATRAPHDPFEARWNLPEAERLRAKGAALLAAPTGLEGDASLEVMAPIGLEHPASNAGFYLRETLRDPNVISVDASMQRSDQAIRAGVLTPALDLIKSVDATTSIEKMICHQMAAAQDAGMGLLIQLREAGDWEPSRLPPPGEQARVTNAAARLFECVQNGALVLLKLKTGGAQRVVVQHQQVVQVGPGGQAVVAETLSPTRRKRSRKGSTHV